MKEPSRNNPALPETGLCACVKCIYDTTAVEQRARAAGAGAGAKRVATKLVQVETNETCARK